jgi:hypothetical protein
MYTCWRNLGYEAFAELIIHAETSPFGPGIISSAKCNNGLDVSYGDYEITCQPECGVVGTPSCLEARALSCLHEYIHELHACLMTHLLQGTQNPESRFLYDHADVICDVVICMRPD